MGPLGTLGGHAAAHDRLVLAWGTWFWLGGPGSGPPEAAKAVKCELQTTNIVNMAALFCGGCSTTPLIMSFVMYGDTDASGFVMNALVEKHDMGSRETIEKLWLEKLSTRTLSVAPASVSKVSLLHQETGRVQIRVVTD